MGQPYISWGAFRRPGAVYRNFARYLASLGSITTWQ